MMTKLMSYPLVLMMLRYAVHWNLTLLYFITFSHMLLSFECCIGAMFIFCNCCIESHSIWQSCAKTVLATLNLKFMYRYCLYLSLVNNLWLIIPRSNFSVNSNYYVPVTLFWHSRLWHIHVNVFTSTIIVLSHVFGLVLIVLSETGIWAVCHNIIALLSCYAPGTPQVTRSWWIY